MADSNEIVPDQGENHPRLRLPQAGIKAQKEYDEGEPLTSVSMQNRMNDVMLDLMNDRIDHGKATAIVGVANVIVKVAALELKNRELYYGQMSKHEHFEAPEPLRLAAGGNGTKTKRRSDDDEDRQDTTSAQPTHVNR